jgi:hypothetical protein
MITNTCFGDGVAAAELGEGEGVDDGVADGVGSGLGVGRDWADGWHALRSNAPSKGSTRREARTNSKSGYRLEGS